MKSKILTLICGLGALALSSNSWADFGDKSADRELAGQLSASLILVASEGQKFARSRDALAKARLQNIHGLEDSLTRLKEGNDLDVRVWTVIGETYRVRLLTGVQEATAEMVAQHAARNTRREQQETDLAATSSAVNLKSAQLLGAAAALATLAEPPAKSAAMTALVKSTLAQFSASLGEDQAKLKQGLTLAEQMLNNTVSPKQ